MSTDRETTRIVRSWLDEGVTQLPDRVLDAVLDQVPATPQRRATWWPAWRRESTNRMIEVGLAAAAVVAAILIGVNAIGTSNVGGPGFDASASTPTPVPSGEPSAEPSATPAGNLSEGPFVLSDGEFDDGVRNVPITVTIPAPGWYGEPGGGMVENDDPDQNFDQADAGLIGPFVGGIYVPADPCDWSTTMPESPATTVDEVVAALRGQASRDASEAVDIAVGGHAGKSITLHVPDDAVLGACDRGRFCSLTVDDPGTCQRWNQFPGQIDEVWILDVNGEVVVIVATWGDETPAGAVSELRGILESVTFEQRIP